MLYQDWELRTEYVGIGLRFLDINKKPLSSRQQKGQIIFLSVSMHSSQCYEERHTVFPAGNSIFPRSSRGVLSRVQILKLKMAMVLALAAEISEQHLQHLGLGNQRWLKQKVMLRSVSAITTTS